MSRGSYFELLKKNRTANLDDLRKMEASLEKIRDGDVVKADDVWMLDIDEKQWGQVADKSKGEVYDSILHLEFNSSFSSLRESCESLGLSPYGNNRMNIDETSARQMIAAIDYILHGKFDPEIERIIGRSYIEIFGELDRKYSFWSYKQMFPEDREYNGNDIEDRRDSLLDIRTILNAFLIAISDLGKNRDEYVLTYVIWG